MSGFPWLLAMIAVPAVGAAGVAALPRGRDQLAKQLALGTSLVVLVLAVLATLAVFLLLRARGTDQSRSPRRSHTTEPIGEKGDSGRPLHVDPDPDNLAGGRARMVDPKGESR